jgi:hypothetical protein
MRGRSELTGRDSTKAMQRKRNIIIDIKKRHDLIRGQIYE